MPFDLTNPIGFSVAFALEYTILGYEAFVIASILSLAIGGYWFAIEATKEFKRFAPVLYSKAKAKANSNESNEFDLLMSEFIDVHGIVKQLS